MKTRASIVILRAAALLATFGCGGTTTSPSGGGGGTFTAVVDGAAWVADANTLSANHPRPGHYVLRGYRVSGSASLNLELDFDNISTPGTYPLGVSSTVFGGIG